MASAGQDIHQVVLVAAAPDDLIQSLALTATGTPGYSISTAGPGTLVFTRKFWPTWVIVVAVLGSLLFLIGLLVLLYRETEVITVVATPVEGGARVTVSGRATGELTHRIGAVLQSVPAIATTSTAAPAFRDATKVCPACAETVQAAAKVCRYCGTRFDTTEGGV